MANGAVIYQGPSMIDGSPIVVVATGLGGRSANRKTGDLVQTWILREDVSPMEAIQTGADVSICGDCPHRGRIEGGRNVGRSCYVNIGQAPLNVWRTFHRVPLANGKPRSGYPTVRADELSETFAGRLVRLGSYGDPAAVPVWVWEAMMRLADGGTGYTHQWRDAAPELARWCMASCDSEADRVFARFMGYRTFRVTPVDSREDRGDREVICPASDEAGKVTNCAACRACGGLSAKAKADIVITVHGPSYAVANGKRNLARELA